MTKKNENTTQCRTFHDYLTMVSWGYTFTSGPSTAKLAQDALDRIATLEAENTSVRAILHEIGAYGNALARQWLEAHPKEEGK